MIFAKLVAPPWLQLFPPFIRLANMSTFFSIVPRVRYSKPFGGDGISIPSLSFVADDAVLVVLDVPLQFFKFLDFIGQSIALIFHCFYPGIYFAKLTGFEPSFDLLPCFFVFYILDDVSGHVAGI